MVVLNFYGITSPICISHKLGLYVSNIPDATENSWRDELADRMLLADKTDRNYQRYLGTSFPRGSKELYRKVFPERNVPKTIKRYHRKALVDRMICLYFDADQMALPDDNWETNCFIERFCEDDYAEKLVGFIEFLSYDTPDCAFPKPMPQWIYSSNHLEIDHYRIFWGGEPAAQYLKSLAEWGAMFDRYLGQENDYMLFDYLVTSIHKDHEHNEYHFIKAFSLCQLFLENEKESELDYKLPLLMEDGDIEQKMLRAASLRKIRNKIAHGDFFALDKELEQYAKEFLDGSFWFDYYEYSRRHWILINVCCYLDDIVRKLIYLEFNDKAKLKDIRAKTS